MTAFEVDTEPAVSSTFPQAFLQFERQREKNYLEALGE